MVATAAKVRPHHLSDEQVKILLDALAEVDAEFMTAKAHYDDCQRRVNLSERRKAALEQCIALLTEVGILENGNGD